MFTQHGKIFSRRGKIFFQRIKIFSQRVKLFFPTQPALPRAPAITTRWGSLKQPLCIPSPNLKSDDRPNTEHQCYPIHSRAENSEKWGNDIGSILGRESPRSALWVVWRWVGPVTDIILCGKNIYPTRKNIFPTRKNIFPTHKNIFPTRETIFPMREQYIYPTQKTIFPTQKNIFPTHKNIFPTRETIFPMREKYLFNAGKYFPDAGKYFSNT